MANGQQEEKGVKARANQGNVPRIKRFSDNDLDQLTTAVAVALGSLADWWDPETDEVSPEERKTRVDFLRKLSQEVQKLGVPF